MAMGKPDPVVVLLKAYRGLTSEQRATARAFIREEDRQTTTRVAKLRTAPKSTAKPLGGLPEPKVS